MKRYLTLIVLVLSSLPVFAAVDMTGMTDFGSRFDVASIVMVMLGSVALIATRKLQHH